MNTSYFPWRIFWRSFFSQFLYFFIAGCATFIFAIMFLSSSEWESEDSLILGIFTFSWLVMSCIISLFLSYKWTSPLSNVILKAERISRRKIAKQMSEFEEDIFEEEVGEYYELENSLNRVARKMKKKRDQLNQEREETQALMSAVMDLIVSIDLEEKVVFFNSHFATHFMNKEQTQGKTYLTEIFRAPEILDLFTRTLKSGEPGEATIKMNSLVDVGIRYYSLTVSPLMKAKSREVYGALAVFHDITEHKKAELIRIEFVSNASHELRTPLTSIKGYVETLLEDFKVGHTEGALSFIEIISRNVNKLIDLVNDLLTISTLESVADLKKETVDPELVTNHVINQLEVQARDKNLVIQYRISSGEFIADSRKVEQVVINLISNAIKYIPNSKKIDVSWERNAQNDVILKVADNGPGIPKEHHLRLFERFYRIDRGRSRDAGGTGLGLAIVKHIMQSHGGTVAVHSELGQGAEFICTFPQNEKVI